MAEEAAKAMERNADLLEWPKKDKRQLLHAVYRAGDLKRTIQFIIDFYVFVNFNWCRIPLIGRVDFYVQVAANICVFGCQNH
ncbi:hypothetical protein SADUNF_Sadunf17G0060700 [Salix dunnii]|uniref:Uncharacterized protein n=1 Tax=Salix dunnii TaxID=1413687 RepID=A0A835J6Q6_9ROSI|nr:hypothetical protein SADUNF_Sadunf17G0060700 [Salix dunnii]